MDERVKKLKTVEDCERFAGNARDRGYEELAQEAQARAVQLKSEKHQARSQVERIFVVRVKNSVVVTPASNIAYTRSVMSGATV